MKISIEATGKITHINQVPCRIWEGTSESGIKVICFITRIAVNKSESEEGHEQFRKELIETKEPSPEAEAFPLRMFID